MKKVVTMVTALVFSLFILSSCNKDTLYGSGLITSQERIISPFTKVRTDGSIDIVITQNAIQKVTVADYSNLVNEIETTLIGDELYIKYRSSNHNINNSKALVTITMPTLYAVNTNGSANINVNGLFTIPNAFTAISRGSGDIVLNAINAMDFNLTTFGSGDIRVTNAIAKNSNMLIDGSGDITSFGLQGENTTVNSNGSGDAEVSASIMLKATIKGSGDITYQGNPTVTKTILGSGSVIRR